MREPEDDSRGLVPPLRDRFVTAASAVLWDASRDSLPDRLERDDGLRLSTRRLLEASAELCDAIDVLQRESLHRPAHALLRALLETTAYVVWLAEDPGSHAPKLWSGDTPTFKALLARIGWEAEYERTYGPLSEFVHPTESRLHMYREIDTGTANGLLPEIRPDGELYVLPEVDGVPYVSFRPMEKEEAESAFGPYVRVKAFDLVIASLLRVFVEGPAAPWWPESSVAAFADLLASDPELSQLMLCSPASVRRGASPAPSRGDGEVGHPGAPGD